jgi:predicted secreted protein
MMRQTLSRRKLLLQSCWLTVSAFFVKSIQAQTIDIYSQKFLISRQLKKEGILIEIPPLADTGNSIPMSILIEPKSQAKVQSFEIIAPENPNPMVMRITLPQSEKKFRMATRIRLALSQDVWVIAKLDDGTSIAESTHCVVTLNACFDAT